jgi:hypothetical protein
MENTMKYYQKNNEVFAYELDGSQDHLIGDKVELPVEEIESHLNPPKTAEQVKVEITSAIQAMLDTQAQSLRYDNMMSARSYAGFVNPFQAEAQSLSVWCANCWIQAGQLEALGVPMTVEEVMAQMPSYIVEPTVEVAV